MENKITIVSCFYIIAENEKRNINDYIYWLSIFLNYIKHPIVFFSDGAMADTIDSLKRVTQPNAPWKCIRKPLDKLGFQEKEWEDYWIECCKKGTNGRVNNPNVYRIWANKLLLLEEVARENPFNTEQYYWCDGACWRNEELARIVGDTWKLPITDDFHFAWVENFGRYTSAEEILLQANTTTIGGAIFGGNKNMIEKIKKRFCLMYEVARRHKLIDLNDQGVLAAAVFDMKNIIHWNAKEYPVLPGCDPWFLFQYLGLLVEFHR